MKLISFFCYIHSNCQIVFEIWVGASRVLQNFKTTSNWEIRCWRTRFRALRAWDEVRRMINIATSSQDLIECFFFLGVSSRFHRVINVQWSKHSNRMSYGSAPYWCANCMIPIKCPLRYNKIVSVGGRVLPIETLNMWNTIFHRKMFIGQP